MIKVWDGATRLFHWALVVAFGFSVYSAFQDKIMTGFDVMHQRSGIVILILVLFRLMWGLFGSQTSLFKNFIRGPKAVIASLRGQDSGAAGHSAVGALSVVLMLVILLAQTLLGLFATDGMLFSGPLSDLAADPERLTLYHRWLGYSLMGVVGLHVLAIIFYKLVKKKALVKAMITGYQGGYQTGYQGGYQGGEYPQPSMKSQWLALALFLLSGAVVCLITFVWLA